MFLFSDAKVRRFMYTNQIKQEKITKMFFFIDINQSAPPQRGL